MDRTGFLIEKLLADYRENVSPAQLMTTLQLLHKELTAQQAQSGEAVAGKRISVIMPGQIHDIFTDDPGEITLTYKNDIPEPVVKEQPVAVEKAVVAEQPVTQPITPAEPVFTVTEPVKKTSAPITETRPDINESMAVNGKSLNEKLSSNGREMSELLVNEPIKDLRKAIGVNDRYVFVNELFRGDETMYERSIKTINGFNIFAEAQYWIERELKIKLGWNDNHLVVKQFYALVRRRFS